MFQLTLFLDPPELKICLVFVIISFPFGALTVFRDILFLVGLTFGLFHLFVQDMWLSFLFLFLLLRF